jgi:EAL domain-containing protein (putative c-di-GMP-specific phosphodiesterase class I)
VETIESKALVAKLGVDFAQGHAIGKPVLFDDVLAEISNSVKVSNA